MAATSNRSPSPISYRPNPNTRSSETNSKIRKSYSGNPFRPSILATPKNFNPVTPANSPSDFGRRHTTEKEGFVATPGFFEEKENDKDPNSKPVKVRSPAVVKGSKNFMTPTISAASKFTPSPRKKVLTERNDPVRVSFDGKPPFVDGSGDTESKPEMGLKYKKVEIPFDSTFPYLDHKEEVVLGPQSTSKAPEKGICFSTQVPSSYLKASDSLSETITVESDCVSVDTTSNIKPCFSSVSPIIAPLDADPSLPPYDPKTNYLSPRPQFLHYKPNPRTELYLNKEKGLTFGDGGKRLEDSFVSENFSDTEFTEESQSEDSLKESEDDSSAEIITEEEEEEEPHVSEPKPISTSSSTHLSEETVKAKKLQSPQFFTRSKFVFFVLVLLIACLSISVTDSPVIGPSVFNDFSFSVPYDPSEILVFAKENFNGFVRNFKHWSANCISSLSRLIHIPDRVDKLGPLQFSNLTALQEDVLVDGYTKIDLIEDKSEERYEEDDLELAPEGEVEMELLEEKGQPEFESDDEISEEASQQRHIEPEIEDNTHLIIQAEVMEADSSQEIQNQEQSDSDFHINSEPQINEVFDDHLSEIEASEVKHDVDLGANDVDLGATVDSAAAEANPEMSSDSDPSLGDAQSVETMSASLHGSEDKLSLHERTSLLVLSLALALVSATAFIYFKQSKTTSPNVAVHVDPLLPKKLVFSSISPTNEHTYQDKAASHNWPTEVDVAGESCPSEMSSFQKSSSYGKKVLSGTNEAQSQERRLRKNTRRESLASSSDYSMEPSPSYGSFTTYEKISSKHGYVDEETVTPVRRSSRIRSQVTSP
ncbi:uncharacterized protein LOC132294173 [Cornus florida]|uniref:uncharacterized protein LOC132294173 n=1 Tax=Cornus florida TaxID=4283 RepID=UPI00289D1E57|nr:uncharacterized protein LOC132294173 [Cornus florida]